MNRLRNAIEGEKITEKQSLNPIIYVVSAKRIVRRITGLYFESRQALEYTLTGMSYGTSFSDKNYAITALLENGELIARNLHECKRVILLNDEQFQTDKKQITK